MKKRNKILLISISILGLIYVIGAFYFNSNIMPNSKLYNENINNLNQETIKKAIDNNSLTLQVKDARKTIEIAMTDVDYSFNDATSVKSDILKKQEKFAWPIKLFQTKNYESAQIKISKQEQERLIKANKIINDKSYIESKDAYFKVDKKTQKISVIEEIVGDELDKTLVIKKIDDTLLKGSLTINLKDAIIMPNSLAVNLEKTITEVEYKLKNDIDIKVDEKSTNIKPTKEDKLKWLNIDYKNNQINIDKKAIQNYINRINQSFVQDEGGSDTVYRIKNGQSTLIKQGKAISGVDEFALTAKIYDAMKNNYVLNESVKAVSISKPKASYEGHYSIDSNFVEVSIAKQKVYLYRDGKLVYTADVVTGKPGGNTDTTKGSYTIMYKTTNFVLKGDAYGYDYKLPVSYWIPFEGGGGIGLHDAPWRATDNFGGSLYLSDGSHGCINMKLADVRMMYNNVVAGTGVWVH